MPSGFSYFNNSKKPKLPKLNRQSLSSTIVPMPIKEDNRPRVSCIACSGTGHSTNGRSCYPCDGTGKLVQEL